MSNPLLLDPTRTLGLRQRFVAEFRRRFRILRRRIIDLVVEQDAFGLKRENRRGTSNNELPVGSVFGDSSWGKLLLANTRFRFLSDPQKVEAFHKWLIEQIGFGILPEN